MKSNIIFLSCLGIALSIWFFSFMFEFHIPVTNFALAMFVPLLGWRKVIVLRVFLSCMVFLVDYPLLFFGFQYPSLFLFVFYYHFYFLFQCWSFVKKHKYVILR